MFLSQTNQSGIMYLWWRPCSYQIFLSEEILLNKNLRLKTLQIKCIMTTQGIKWSCFYFFEIQNVQCMLHFFFYVHVYLDYTRKLSQNCKKSNELIRNNWCFDDYKFIYMYWYQYLLTSKNIPLTLRHKLPICLMCETHQYTLHPFFRMGYK